MGLWAIGPQGKRFIDKPDDIDLSCEKVMAGCAAQTGGLSARESCALERSS